MPLSWTKPCSCCVQVYLLQKEKASLETGHLVQEEQEQVLRVRLQHLQEELGRRQGEPGGRREGEREAVLRARVESLLATLDSLATNSQLRQQQAAELIEDLKRANG